MHRVLFIITSDSNMGDLALCSFWSRSLGRERYTFIYLLPQLVSKFVDPVDVFVHYQPKQHVRDAISGAVKRFLPDVVIYATNSFWSIEGQAGAEFGQFVPLPDDCTIPVCSFDPICGQYGEQSPLLESEVVFEGVPDNVISLRFTPKKQHADGVRHFHFPHVFEQPDRLIRQQFLESLGLDGLKQLVLFPMSANRTSTIRGIYYDYYWYLAHLLGKCDPTRIQFVVLSPIQIREFDALSNVTQVPLVNPEAFCNLVQYSNLFLTDSAFSTLMLACWSGVPAVHLQNSYEKIDDTGISLSKGHLRYRLRRAWACFANKSIYTLSAFGKHLFSIPPGKSFWQDDIYRFQVFPFGFFDLCTTLESRYGYASCVTAMEIFDDNEFAATIEGILFSESRRQSFENASRQYRAECRELPTPADIMNELLCD